MNPYYPTTRDVFGIWLNEQGLVGDGVEVGVAFGYNATMILSQWKGKHLFLVDPWAKQPRSVCPQDDSIDYERCYHQCLELSQRDPRAIIRRGLSTEVAKAFGKGTLDFVYLDGNHSLKAVQEDMSAWFPAIKSGGVLCGHDYYYAKDAPHYCEVSDAVPRWMGPRNLSFSWTPCSSWWCRIP